MLASLGLSVICLAWLYEFYLVFNKKNHTISSVFVGGYSLGVLLLVVDGYNAGMSSMSWLNFISFLLSAGILIGLMKK